MVLLSTLLLKTALCLTLGNPNAPKGGKIIIGEPLFPKSVFYYFDPNEVSESISLLIFETLIELDPQTLEPLPLLANQWKESEDHKSIAFTLHEQAKFSDGKEVSSADIKFSWNLVQSLENHHPIKKYFSIFEGCEVVSPKEIIFKLKEPHIKTLQKLSKLFILPQHIFEQSNRSPDFFIGSGPYLLKEVIASEKIVLKRNPNFWALKFVPQRLGHFHFDEIEFRTMPSIESLVSALKKGEIDYLHFFSSESWVHFKEPKIEKMKIENKHPFSTHAIAWNLKKTLFQDKNIRRALSHLMNREKWIKDLFHNEYSISTGLVSPSSEFHSKNNKALKWNPKEAKKLLSKAGWKKGKKDTFLTKDGKKFEFEIATSFVKSLPFLKLYQQDLQKEGMVMHIKEIDGKTMHTLLSTMENFDGMEVVLPREEGSFEASGFENDDEKKIITQINSTFEPKERKNLIQKLDTLMGENQNLSFLWEPKTIRIAYWKKFLFEGKGFYAFSNWKNIFHSWWIQPSLLTSETK